MGIDSDAIIAKKDALSQASLKIGQAIYSKQQASEASEATEEKKDDSTVDADFTEKSDEEKKKDDEKEVKNIEFSVPDQFLKLLSVTCDAINGC
jgi:molecular chaperone DnaK